MAEWEFNCPKYVNLSSSVDEGVEQLEKYFEVDHEEEQNFRRLTRSASAVLAASAAAQSDAQGTLQQGSCMAGRTGKKANENDTKSEVKHQVGAIPVSSTEVISSSTHTSSGKENTQRSTQVRTAGNKAKHSKVVNSKQRRPLRFRNAIASSCNIALSKQRASAVEKPSTSAKMHTVLVRKCPAPSAVGKSAAGLSLRKGVATSAVSKPVVPTAVKKSMPPLDVKKHVVPLLARQHVRPSAIGKSAAASSVQKRASPAPRKPAAPPAAQCQSLAEFVGKFHSKTPTRFRRVPKDPGGQRQDMAFKKPTIPVTPKLATQLRSRAVSSRDQKQKEEQVDVCVSKPKRPKVEAVQVNTWAAPVSKPALRAKKAEQNPMASNLAPKPLQTEKLATTVASKQVSRRVTIAKSPAFALKLRSETWKQRKQTEKSTLNLLYQLTTKLVPDGIQKCFARSKSVGICKPEPTRPNYVEQHQKCMEIKTQTSRFHARPAPDPNKVFLPRNSSLPPTKPRPFRLASVERHEQSLRDFERKKQQMEEERIQKAKFIARPAPSCRRARSASVDQGVVNPAAKPGPSVHVSRSRRRR